MFLKDFVKKILIISESSVFTDFSGNLISRGGGASFTHNLALSLIKTGNYPVVFALKEFPEQSEYEKISGVVYLRKFSSNRSSFRLIKYLYLALKESKSFDCIVLNQFLPHLLLPFFSKKRTYAILHDVYLDDLGFWFRQFGFIKGIFGFVAEYLQLFCDRFFADFVITVSESSRDKFLKRFRGANKKIFLLRNSLNFSEYKTLPKEDYLLFVGRFVAYKRPKDLIFVLKKVREKYPKMGLKFVVTRDFLKIRNEIIELAKASGIEDFEFIENCPSDILKNLYSKAKILVHPSVVEGQGIVVLEALASGTPVCAYNLHAYKGMLENGVNCELCEKKNVSVLADCVLKILENYEYYRNNTGKKLSEFSVKNFDTEVVRIFE